jgi:hypothetical protein
MRFVRARASATLALFFCLTLVAYAGVGCQSAPKANAAATSNTQQTLQPLLQEVARNHPDQAGTVNALLAAWPSQPERTSYQQALPLLALEKKDRPDLANLIDDKLYSWDKRLSAMGQ